jgi:transposase InsO family protein
MPWQESSPMSERLQFIQACLNRRESIVEICARFGVSEKTGHKWLVRFQREGPDGLTPRSHAAHTVPHRVAPGIVERIVALRKQHPDYGAPKLRDWLVQHEPGTRWPAASTIGAVLLRAGLIRSRRRRGATHTTLATGRTQASAPNVVWTADFKGEFRLTSGAWCYPLTVLDLHSHYLLGCQALGSVSVAPTRAAFVQLFHTYGLPDVLRTDNGVPFGQPNALGRLGALGFWWVRLGIRPERIRPARPAENGAHERFHKTLKAATTEPRAPSFRAQQQRFVAFQQEYNHERPHASLPAHAPPAQLYTPSTRPYPTRLPRVQYPAGSELRRVMAQGSIRWRNAIIYLSSNLVGEHVLLSETPTDLITVRYGSLALGELDPDTTTFLPRVRWVD